MPKKKPEQLRFDDYQLKEVTVRLVLNESAGLYSSAPIRDSQDAANVLADVMKELDREMVCAVNLDCKLRPINYTVISIGSLNASPVPVSNTFKTAIIQNAAGVLLAHNHP